MKQFHYKAIDKSGLIFKGNILASNRGDAYLNLTKDAENTIISLKRNWFYLPLTSSGSAFSSKVQKDDIINITRQLHMLLMAGIPIPESLNIVRSLSKNRAVKSILKSIIDAVKTGELFSQGVARHVTHFGTDYVALVKAGEKAGALDQILSDLHQLMSWEKNLLKRIKGALRYPIIVISVALIAMFGMFKFVVPKFTKIFMKTKHDMPLPTKILLMGNTFITKYGLLIFVLTAVVTIACFAAYKKNEKFRYNFDKITLQIPVFGSISHKYIIARFCKVFSILYSRGVPIINALKISKEVNKNNVYKADVEIMIHN
jgi:type II secretory pathway component PulF